MSLKYDPEFGQVLEALKPHMPKRTPLDLDNIPAARPQREGAIESAFSKLPESPDVQETWFHANASDGYSVPIHSFTKRQTSSKPTSAVVHFHGGGFVMGSSVVFARTLANLVSTTSVPIFSVDYRLAPEHTGSTLVEDCYSAVTWIYENAKDLNIDSSRIALFGESAGGGLAVGVALLAKDRKLSPPLAKQILVYPMLDDRTTFEDPIMEPLAFWKTTDNVTAWRGVLGPNAGKPNVEISPYSAPGRATNLEGLPSAYIDVGGFDIFLKENIAYAQRLLAAHVEVELHVYPGLPHAFEMIAPNIESTKRAIENRSRALLSV